MVRICAIRWSEGSVSVQMRPHAPAATTASNRLGSFFWRHSTAQGDLQRVNDVLCGPYDGVLVITFLCYADDAEVCAFVYTN